MKATVHIFGYGEAQIISDSVNFKTKSENLSKLKAVIDDIKSKKPSDKIAAEYHAINIFGDIKADYISKKPAGAKISDDDKSSFSVSVKDLDGKKLDALVAEFEKLAKA